jgi:hypothetical protein
LELQEGIFRNLRLLSIPKYGIIYSSIQKRITAMAMVKSTNNYWFIDWVNGTLPTDHINGEIMPLRTGEKGTLQYKNCLRAVDTAFITEGFLEESMLTASSAGGWFRVLFRPFSKDNDSTDASYQELWEDQHTLWWGALWKTLPSSSFNEETAKNCMDALARNMIWCIGLGSNDSFEDTELHPYKSYWLVALANALDKEGYSPSAGYPDKPWVKACLSKYVANFGSEATWRSDKWTNYDFLGRLLLDTTIGHYAGQQATYYIGWNNTAFDKYDPESFQLFDFSDIQTTDISPLSKSANLSLYHMERLFSLANRYKYGYYRGDLADSIARQAFRTDAIVNGIWAPTSMFTSQCNPNATQAFDQKWYCSTRSASDVGQPRPASTTLFSYRLSASAANASQSKDDTSYNEKTTYRAAPFQVTVDGVKHTRTLYCTIARCSDANANIRSNVTIDANYQSYYGSSKTDTTPYTHPLLIYRNFFFESVRIYVRLKATYKYSGRQSRRIIQKKVSYSDDVTLTQQYTYQYGCSVSNSKIICLQDWPDLFDIDLTHPGWRILNFKMNYYENESMLTPSNVNQGNTYSTYWDNNYPPPNDPNKLPFANPNMFKLAAEILGPDAKATCTTDDGEVISVPAVENDSIYLPKEKIDYPFPVCSEIYDIVSIDTWTDKNGNKRESTSSGMATVYSEMGVSSDDILNMYPDTSIECDVSFVNLIDKEGHPLENTEILYEFKRSDRTKIPQ